MEWLVILVLVLMVSIMLIPAVLIWYMNIGGAYTVIKEGRFKFFEPILRRIRIGLAVVVPICVYALLIWFFFSNFGWQVALILALTLPIVLFVPLLVWAAVASGLYLVARDTLRRRVTVFRRRITRVAEE